VKKAISKTEFENFWRSLTDGQQTAYALKLWHAAGESPERMQEILRGEFGIELKDMIVKLADQNGRLIPRNGIKGKVVDANRNFRLIQPEFDYAARLAALQEVFPEGTKFPTADAFRNRVGELTEEVRGNKQCSNLLRGVYLPIVLPQLTVADYGTTLEQTFLVAVKRAYQRCFPERTFYNYREGTLAGQVLVMAESRHQMLLDRMVEGPVIDLYFATALHGYGIEADRHQIEVLPSGYTLSGGFDSSTAVAMYPDVLARDWNTPGLDMAALQWQEPRYSLYFKSYDRSLAFGRRALDPDADYSGGLSFVGSVCG
jgi:hypothetical protein